MDYIAERLGVSVVRVRQLLKAGRLPGEHSSSDLRHPWRVRREQIDVVINARLSRRE